jgi:hypothetical protein
MNEDSGIWRVFSLLALILTGFVLIFVPKLGQSQGSSFGGIIGTVTGSSGSDITGLFVDVSRIHHDAESNGDTWDFIWADDDVIYSFNGDGRGYGKQSRNVGFNKLVGAQWDHLSGSLVNEMVDYGKGGQEWPNGMNWKPTGADCIDGVIYAFVDNDWYGFRNAYGGNAVDSHLRETVNNMSLIKSADKGLTWTRDAQANYDHPMWTSRKFSTAYFVKYGQNGGRSTQDDQDKYVYAISNDGYWNCGSYFYLGRVSRSKIGNLNPADWEFLSDGKWSGKVEDATPVPGFPNGWMKCTMGSPIWLGKIRKYVTVTWFDPGTTVKFYYPENVTFAFYQADHPWGPWACIGEKSAGDFIADTKQRISRWYGASLSPKFITDNPDGSVTAILTFSGEDFDDKPASLYKNNSCPVTFYTKPQPKEVQSFNDTDARYSANWSYERDRNVGDYHNDAHVTTRHGEYVDFTFTGRGIEVLSEKNSDMGEVEVLIDGASKGTFSLYQDPMPRLYQVEFYRNMNLANGTHTVRVVNKAPDGTPCIIDGFRVYGGTDFDPKAFYMLVNRVSGRVLGISEETPAVKQLDRRESRGLQWRIRAAGASWYKIVNRQSGKALGTGANDPEGAVLQQYSDGNSPNLLWKVSAVGNGSFSIVNRANDMAVSGGSGTSATESVSQFAYYGRDNQKWEIVKVR